MKITRAQSQENRARVVETASALFRERGYEGVSVAELMDAAGLTHGGFYKHFGSKADLMIEATAQGLATKMAEYKGVGPAEFIERYLSRAHRDDRGSGCAMSALCGDAARQPAAVQATLADGIARMLAAMERVAMAAGADRAEARARAVSLFAQLLGTLVLSRACPGDSSLAGEILDLSRQQLLAALGLAGGDAPGPAGGDAPGRRGGDASHPTAGSNLVEAS